MQARRDPTRSKKDEDNFESENWRFLGNGVIGCYNTDDNGDVVFPQSWNLELKIRALESLMRRGQITNPVRVLKPTANFYRVYTAIQNQHPNTDVKRMLENLIRNHDYLILHEHGKTPRQLRGEILYKGYIQPKRSEPDVNSGANPYWIRSEELSFV